MVLAQPAYADEVINQDLTVSVKSKQPDPAGVEENVTVIFDLTPFKPEPPRGESVDSKWKHQRFYLTTKAAGEGDGDDGVISSVTVGAVAVTRGAPKVVGIYTVSWWPDVDNVVEIKQTGHTGPGCGVCTPEDMVRQLGLVAAFAEPGKKLVECRGGIDHDKWVPPQPEDPIVRVDKYTDTKTGKLLKTEETPVWGACRTELFVLEMESTEWLVTHDPVFESDFVCHGWGKCNQASLMGNKALIQVKCLQADAGKWTVQLFDKDKKQKICDAHRTGYSDGCANFELRTTIDIYQTDLGYAYSDGNGAIYIEGYILSKGPGAYWVRASKEGGKVLWKNMMIAPLMTGLEFDPKIVKRGTEPFPNDTLDPYTNAFDLQLPENAEKGKGYGLLIQYQLSKTAEGGYQNRANEKTMFAFESDPEAEQADRGDINNTHYLRLTAAEMEAAAHRIKWEGFTDDFDSRENNGEQGREVYKAGDPATIQEAWGPNVTPTQNTRQTARSISSWSTAAEGKYVLRAKCILQSDPTQVQCYSVQFDVKYATQQN